jgi:hypothetical protein
MTPQETIDAFQHYIDQFTTARAPSIDFWINEAIESFIKTRSHSLIQKSFGFQTNQRIRDELDEIVRFNVTGVYVDGILDYPADCYQLLANSIGCQTAVQATKEVPYIQARARTWDWYFANQRNPFVKPAYKEGRLIYIESDAGIHIFPGIVFNEVVLSYIKEWVPFDLALENPIPLSENSHQEITRLAGAKYLLSIQNFEGAKALMAQNFQE